MQEGSSTSPSPALAAFEAFRQHPRAHVETLVTSRAGIIISSFNASASAVCSFIIIVIILRSNARLGTVYHRILFAMSFWDITQSIAMAFTTLPMPSDMIYDQFQGTVAGSTSTCDAQGFMVILGAINSLFINAVLCIYYLCSICFKMKDERFRKVLEVPLYIFSFLIGLGIALTAVLLGQINPSPVRVPWCAHSRYPWWCNDDIPSCVYERGNHKASRPALKFSNITLFLSAIVVVLSMAVIVCYLAYQERSLKLLVQRNTRSDSDQCGEERMGQRRLRLYRKNMQFTRDAIISALMYTLAFLATWHYILIRIFYPKLGRQNILEWFRLFFRPLQGVFNMIIFIHHKMRNIRTHNLQTGLCEAFWQVLTSQTHPEYIVSNLTLVRRNHCIGELDLAIDEDRDEEDDDNQDNTKSHLNDGVSCGSDGINLGKRSLVQLDVGVSQEGGETENIDGNTRNVKEELINNLEMQEVFRREDSSSASMHGEDSSLSSYSDDHRKSGTITSNDKEESSSLFQLSSSDFAEGSLSRGGKTNAKSYYMDA